MPKDSLRDLQVARLTWTHLTWSDIQKIGHVTWTQQFARQANPKCSRDCFHDNNRSCGTL